MDVLYFILSVIGGFFVIGIPFSGLILIMLRRNKPATPVTTNDNTHDDSHGSGRKTGSATTPTSESSSAAKAE